MATHAATGQPHHSNTPLIAAVAVIAAALAAVLIWQAATTQSTLQTNRTTGIAQRTDQEQVSCALWNAIRADKAIAVDASVAAAANRVCGTLPTPVPSSP